MPDYAGAKLAVMIPNPQTARRLRWKHSESGENTDSSIPPHSTLTLFGFSNPSFPSSLLSSLYFWCNSSFFCPLTSRLWSSPLKSQCLSQLASGHKPSSTMAQCQARAREPKTEGGRQVRWKEQWKKEVGEGVPGRQKRWQVRTASAQNKRSGPKKVEKERKLKRNKEMRTTRKVDRRWQTLSYLFILSGSLFLISSHFIFSFYKSL